MKTKSSDPNSMTSTLAYLVARLSEPSTWATITAVLTGLGVTLPAGVTQNIIAIGTGFAGLLGVLLRERTTANPGE
jgi:hypothetical protein